MQKEEIEMLKYPCKKKDVNTDHMNHFATLGFACVCTGIGIAITVRSFYLENVVRHYEIQYKALENRMNAKLDFWEKTNDVIWRRILMLEEKRQN